MAYKYILDELRLISRSTTRMTGFARKYLAIAVTALLVSSLLINQVQAAAGDLDTSFGTGGTRISSMYNSYDRLTDLALQKDGKMIAAGYSIATNRYDFVVARYSSDGNLDRTFSGDGRTATDFGGSDFGHDVAIQANGRIVVAGESFADPATKISDFAIARYSSTGTLDTSFSSDGKWKMDFLGGINALTGLVIQPDGKILAAGYAETSSGSGVFDFALVRLNSNGSFDKTFDQDGMLTTDFSNSTDKAYGISLQRDGKIVVAGHSLNLSTGKYDFAVARYNSNGSLDNSFSGDGKLTTDFVRGDDFPSALTIQPDQKILVAGTTRDANQNHKVAVARYLVDGRLDRTFSGDGKQITPFTGKSAGLSSIEVLSNGKIVAAGYTFATSSDVVLVRYNINGSLDTTFSGDGKVMVDFGGDEAALAMVIQPNGKIVVGGLFGYDPNLIYNYDFFLARFLGDNTAFTNSPAVQEVTDPSVEASVTPIAPAANISAWENQSWKLPSADSSTEQP